MLEVWQEIGLTHFMRVVIIYIQIYIYTSPCYIINKTANYFNLSEGQLYSKIHNGMHSQYKSYVGGAILKYIHVRENDKNNLVEILHLPPAYC